MVLIGAIGCGRLGFDEAGRPNEDASDGAPDDSGLDGTSICTTSDRCDGFDNDCDAAIDEDGCPVGCTGAARGAAGYVFCANPISSDAARASCAAAGGALARIDDAAENTWLRTTADAMGFATFLWIGGRDDLVEGEWRWPDGAQFWQGDGTGGPTGLFVNWTASEPDDSGNREDCALLWTDGNWRDYACSDLNLFVCELPPP